MRSAGHFIIVCCLAFLCIISKAFSAGNQEPLTSFAIPKNSEQIILVTAISWNTKDGKLQRYKRINSGWEKVGVEIIVALGKNGLAWGSGLHNNNAGTPGKREGDGKAPAGVFSLGTMFGYNQTSPSTLGYPYRQSTARDYLVDDVNSKDYNQWISIPADKVNAPKERWASFERMKREDHLYEYGIVIAHNSDPIEKGKGSAIFFHVWRNPGAPTLGCTSMSKENLIELMKWLDPKKNPLLIQVPVSALHKL